MDDFDLIYSSTTGSLVPGYEVPWIESIFVEGTKYNAAYDRLWAARERLCQRFNIDWDDDDWHELMTGFYGVQMALGKAIFENTVQYAKRGFQL